MIINNQPKKHDMGLDQYAVRVLPENAKKRKGKILIKANQGSDDVIATWRKHPNLQWWMYQLWLKKNPKAPKLRTINMLGESFDGAPAFNAEEKLELKLEDLDRLEAEVKAGTLPHTDIGWFWGSPCDMEERKNDLEFIAKARLALYEGFKVFYFSWW